MANVFVDFSSQGGDQLIGQLKTVEGGFKKTQAAVSALASASNQLSGLARSLGTTASEAAKLSSTLGLSVGQTKQAVAALQQLVGAGASTDQRFAILSKTLGLSRTQFEALDRAVLNYNKDAERAAIAAKKQADALLEQERAAKRAVAAQQELRGLTGLAQSLGLTSKGATDLAKSLGLTSTQSLEAVKTIQQLNAISATTQEKFNALNKTLGVSSQQFLALDKAVTNYNNKIAQSEAEAEQAAAAAEDYARSLDRLEKEAKAAELGLQAIAVAAGAIAIGIGKIFSDGISEFARFDSALRQTGVIAGEIGTEQFAALREEVEELGILKTPEQIARLSTELARAGFNSEQTAEALEGVVNASVAAGEDLSRTGEIVATTARAFNETENFQQVADLLVQTANSTTTSVNGLGESLKYVSAQAFAANQPIDDTLALLGLLGDAGIQGSQAGTNLAAALERLKLASAGAESEFTNLVRGNRKRVEAFEILRTSVRNSDGSMKSLIDILPVLKQNLDGLSQGDRDIIFNALFGVEGGRAIQVLLNATDERIKEVTDSLDGASGAAARAAEQMTDGLAGSLTVLQNSATVTSQKFGEFAAVGIEPLAKAATALLQGFNQLPEPIQAVLIGITGFAGAIAGAIAVTTALIIANKQLAIVESLVAAQKLLLTSATKALGLSQVGTAASTTALSGAMGRLSIAAKAAQASLLPLAVVGAGIAAIYGIRLTKALEDTNIALEDLQQREQVSGQQSIGLATQLKDAVEAQNDAREKGIQLTDEEIAKRNALIAIAQDQIKANEDEINRLKELQGQTTDPAQIAAFDALIQSYQTSNGAIQTQIDALGGQVDAASEAASATEEQASAQDALAQAYDEANRAIAESEAQKQLEIQRLESSGAISAEDANNRRLQATQERINAEIEAEKAKLAALEALGVQEDPEAEQERLQAISDTRVAIAQKETELLKGQAEQQQKIEADRLNQLKRTLDESIALSRRAETQRNIDTQRALNAGVISQEQADQQRLQSTRDRLSAELEAQQANIAALEALPDPNDPEQAEEREQQIRDAIQTTADLQLQILENEAQQQEAVRQAAIQGIRDRLSVQQQASQQAIATIEQETAAYDLQTRALERQNSLLQSQAALQQAQSGLRGAIAQGEIDKLNRAIELQNQLAETQDAGVRRELQNQLRLLGVQGNQEAIIRRITELEEKRVAQERRDREAAQAIARRQLELDIQREEIAQRRAVAEARINELKAKQAELEAQAAVEEARAIQDPAERERQLRIAEQQLDIAQQQVELSGQLTSDAQQQAALFSQVAQNRREQLRTEQRTADLQAEQAAATRVQAAQLRQAEVSSRRISQNLTLSGTPRSLRKGGSVEAGELVQVHRDEFFVPKTQGTILNQRDSRAVVEQALASGSGIGRSQLTTLSPRTDAALLKEIQKLRKEVGNLQSLNVGTIYNSNQYQVPRDEQEYLRAANRQFADGLRDVVNRFRLG